MWDARCFTALGMPPTCCACVCECGCICEIEKVLIHAFVFYACVFKYTMFETQAKLYISLLSVMENRGASKPK